MITAFKIEAALKRAGLEIRKVDNRPSNIGLTPSAALAIAMEHEYPVGPGTRSRALRHLQAIRDVTWARGQDLGGWPRGPEGLAFPLAEDAKKAADKAATVLDVAPLPPRWSLHVVPDSGAWAIALVDEDGRTVGRL